MRTTCRRTLISVGLLAAAALAANASESKRAVLDDGRMEFEENCTACHGKDGTGTGELAVKLVKPPKDLTAIAARNGGVFPFWQVFEIIAGETPVAGHDTFQMPQYSKRMRAQEGAPGFLPAHVRVLELTHYLESIQKK
ncbi:MAG: c-type cytochrome [Hyphomicrobium sp.]|jgi:mono/diheme cytochrome c family protein